MSDSVRPHRRQPTRLPHPWDSPGKNTGVGCHFLLQCMKVKSESEVAQSCPTPSDPMDCSLPGSSIHGIFQARVLEWGAIAFSDTSLQGSQMVSTLNSNQAFLLIREVGIFSSKQSPALAAKPLLWWPSLCFCSLFSVSSEFPNQCCKLLGCQREILCFFSPVLPIDYSYLPCARG